MMKRSFRDAWSAELRSGKHKQGFNSLNSHGGKCCLGVRCEMDTEMGIMAKTGSVVITYRELNDSNGTVAFPTGETLARWGLDTNEACLMASMNDAGKKFDRIADYLDTLPVEED